MLLPSRIWIYLVVALSLPLVAACIGVSSSVSQPPTVAAPEATDTPAEVSSAAEESAKPLDTPTPELAAEPVDWTMIASVEGDYYILGNPNAPIRLIDFSDFL